MAEKKCPKCDAAISRLMRVCPHCGARVATGPGTEIGLVLGLLVLAGAAVVVVKASTHASKPAAPALAPAPVQTVAVQTPAVPPPHVIGQVKTSHGGTGQNQPVSLDDLAAIRPVPFPACKRPCRPASAPRGRP